MKIRWLAIFAAQALSLALGAGALPLPSAASAVAEPRPAAETPAGSTASSASSSALSLAAGDLRIVQLSDGGYHLYIRAKRGLGSVLLTESTKDPASKTDSFAYRALERSPANDGEMRILGGKKLPSGADQRFLVDSTIEPDPVFGKAFHIFIPWVVAWGYPWSRSGKEFIHDGSFVNIRSFLKPYADYSGAFVDNPYVIRVTQTARAAPPVQPAAPASSVPVPSATASSVPVPAPASSVPVPASSVPVGGASKPLPLAPPSSTLYFPETIAAFSDLAKASGGELRYAASDRDIAAQIDSLVAREKGRSLDLVLCLDATDSMINGIDDLKAQLPGLMAKRAADLTSYRIGIVAYKDYFEEYLYKRLDFTRDLATLTDNLESIHAGGGRDVPEAVYEGLYAAIGEFPWEAEAKLVILVGDAPPHPLPRGSVGVDDVLEAARAEGVEMDEVAVPK